MSFRQVHRGDPSQPIQLGICAMEKKVSSKPMKAILDHLLRKGDIEAVIFPEELILKAPVEEWPRVDVLISFFSDGFPLDKAERYVSMHKVPCLNDVIAQRLLLDRRHVYTLLAQIGIPIPKAVVVERDEVTGELRGEAAKNFEEGDDYIIVGDTKINKPFVEKPVDAEDHNICIYYPSSAGGGVKRLFRKVADRSSEFIEHSTQIRRDKTYMYEPFMKTQGTDIKVYTVGPKYAHAEARKSPVIDGIVNRNGDGKEVRFPVVLTPKEKDMASRISKEFMQMVCGFDLLRTSDGSFVIDVNGWSFVKGLPKYYEDAAWLLREEIIKQSGRDNLGMSRVDSALRCPDLTSPPGREPPMHCLESESKQKTRSDRWEHEELLAVIGIIRHGDRTPKNKTKLTTSLPAFLGLHKKWSAGPKKEAKLKTPAQLQDVLDATYTLIGHSDDEEMPLSRSRAPSPPPACSRGAANAEMAAATARFMPERADAVADLDTKTAEAVRLIRTVLQSGGSFDGIYRKVQLKPQAWKTNESGEEEVIEVQIILKYGGILTQVGVQQAESLGHNFRNAMYPGEEETASEGPSRRGLLRLHATQRHDFKVYSSDEGRVQMSAASFSRGLLDLEKGSLTPVCVALVETDSTMLDVLPSGAVPWMEEAKSRLYTNITGDTERSRPTSPSNTEGGTVRRGSLASGGSTRRGSLELISGVNFDDDKWGLLLEGSQENPDGDKWSLMLEGFNEVLEHVVAVTRELSEEAPCGEITKPLLVQKRWEKLREDMWDKKKKSWDISKFPEIYDAVKFDLIHHPKLAKSFVPLYHVSKRINTVIVPNEYGWDARSRLKIGSVVCDRLLKKVMIDLNNTLQAIAPCEEEAKIQEEKALPLLMRTDATKLLTSGSFGDIMSAIKEHFGFGEGLEPGIEEQSPSAPQDEVVPLYSRNDTADEEVFKEAEFAGLDTMQAGDLRSPHRRVRTRLYFTSESHIQTLMNVLRHSYVFGAKAAPGVPSDDDADASSSSAVPEVAGGNPLVCPEMERWLRENPMLEYLTQIVFRLYEDKRVPLGSPERFRVEVLFSPGACETTGRPDESGASCLEEELSTVQPLRPLHASGQPLTYERLQELLSPFVPRQTT